MRIFDQLFTGNLSFSPPHISWVISALKILEIPESYAKNSPLISTSPVSKSGPPRNVAVVPGNGNCGFNSLSYLLTGTVDHHLQIRKKIMDHVIKRNLFCKIYFSLMYQKLLSFSGKEAVQNAQEQLAVLKDIKDSAPMKYWCDAENLLTFGHLVKCEIFSYSQSLHQYRKLNPHILLKKRDNADDYKYLPNLIIEYNDRDPLVAHYNAVIDVYELP